MVQETKEQLELEAEIKAEEEAAAKAKAEKEAAARAAYDARCEKWAGMMEKVPEGLNHYDSEYRKIGKRNVLKMAKSAAGYNFTNYFLLLIGACVLAIFFMALTFKEEQYLVADRKGEHVEDKK